jgi:hypothetical protein
VLVERAWRCLPWRLGYHSRGGRTYVMEGLIEEGALRGGAHSRGSSTHYL